MIKVQEVRVGNHLKIDGVIVKIDERTIFDFNHDRRVKEPIPLTEEILLKCGFEKIDNEFVISIYQSKFVYSETMMLWRGEYLNQCKYLHQLQNLYFVLTNEELEIKL